MEFTPGIHYSTDNTIAFYPSGAQSYAKRWQLLENAKKTIHIVTFSFMKDETTQKLFDLLKRKLSENVEVIIIYDDIVNRTTFVGSWLASVKKAGATLLPYNELYRGWKIYKGKGHPIKQVMLHIKLKLKQHFHEKYMVVDGQHLILGGINWGNKYAFGGIEPKAWRDTDVYLQGSVVKDVQLQFLRDVELQTNWQRTRGMSYAQFAENYLSTYNNKTALEQKYAHLLSTPAHAGGIAVAYMAHKPYDTGTLNLTNEILKLIAAATTRIYWGCHGTRPPKIYFEYLADAVKRGVEVVLVTNSAKSAKTLMVNGLMGWMYWECTKHYKHLLETGVKLYEWQKPGAYHSKNLLIDDELVAIGSYNIANGSTFHHSESNIVVRDMAFNKLVFNQFQADLKDCKQILLPEVTSRLPKVDAYYRPIHERNKLIDPALLPENIKDDLNKGNYKAFPLYEFIDIS